MLQVIDQNDTDLLLNPMVTMERQIAAGTVAIPVYAQVVDPGNRVSATVDWGDGTQSVLYAEQDSPLVIDAQRRLGFGTYYVTVSARNTKSPEPDTVKVVFPWQITELSPVAPATKNIFGPVLPRDDGLPNNQTWNFDTGSDLQLLASNIKMLLITTKGERIMTPTYGTNLRRIIFELSTISVEAILQQEISQAIAQWEPRVTLQTILINRDANTRQVGVEATFLSRQSGQPLQVNLQFAQ